MFQPKDTDWMNRYITRPIYIYMLSIIDLLQTQRHTQIECKGWKKIFRANGNQKKAGVAILMSEKINLKMKNITRDKEGHYIMIKGSIQEDIIIVTIYTSSIGTPQQIRQTLTDVTGELNSSTIIAEDFNTHSHQRTNHQTRK